jgi:hypothetical protein
MASTTKGDEVFFQIGSELTFQLHMMNLEILGPAASLASPAITPERLLAETSIGIRVHAKSGLSSDG